jgi:hypothetical protein
MHVLSFLAPEDLAKSAQVSRSWRAGVDDEQLWRLFHLFRFGKCKKPEPLTWKQFVISNLLHECTLTDNMMKLLWASENGHDQVVKRVLKSAGDSIQVRKRNKMVLKAAYKGHKEVVDVLLANGAQIEAATKSGFTALHMACGKGHLDVVASLLAQNAQIEAKNKNGSTPLHTAAQKGHADVVLMLLQRSPPANIEAANNNGVRPLNSAAHKGHSAVVNILIQHNADLNACNKNGITPLYSAAHRGHYDIVETLLAHNANIELLPPLFFSLPFLLKTRDSL